MTEWQERGEKLLDEFNACIKAKPRHNAVDIQLEKDAVSKFAVHLNRQITWGTDNEIAEAYYQLDVRMEKLKTKLVMEILTHGSV